MPITVRLTPREEQLANCLERCLSDKEIAFELGVSTETVSQYLNRLYKKLGVVSSNRRTEVALLVRGNQIIIPTTRLCSGCGLAFEASSKRSYICSSCRKPRKKASGPEHKAGAPITPRLVQVLNLLANDASNAEIAAALLLPKKSVKTYVVRLYARTGISGQGDGRKRLALWWRKKQQEIGRTSSLEVDSKAS